VIPALKLVIPASCRKVHWLPIKNKVFQRCKAKKSEVYNALFKGLVFIQVTSRNKCGMTMCLNLSQYTSFRPYAGKCNGYKKKNKVFQRCKAKQSEVNNVLSKSLVFIQVTSRNKCGMTMCLNLSQSTSFRPYAGRCTGYQ